MCWEYGAARTLAANQSVAIEISACVTRLFPKIKRKITAATKGATAVITLA